MAGCYASSASGTTGDAARRSGHLERRARRRDNVHLQRGDGFRGCAADVVLETPSPDAEAPRRIAPPGAERRRCRSLSQHRRSPDLSRGLSAGGTATSRRTAGERVIAALHEAVDGLVVLGREARRRSESEVIEPSPSRASGEPDTGGKEPSRDSNGGARGSGDTRDARAAEPRELECCGTWPGVYRTKRSHAHGSRRTP